MFVIPIHYKVAHHNIRFRVTGTNVLERGCVVYRPSFRGSGQSAGLHDEGFGETDDILEVIKYARRQHIDLPFLAGGFSFGAHVMAKCYAALPVELQPSKVILCGLPTATVAGLRHYVTPQIKGDILFIHGEADDVTLLSDMIEWAKPQRHLVTICLAQIISLPVI